MSYGAYCIVLMCLVVFSQGIYRLYDNPSLTTSRQSFTVKIYCWMYLFPAI